MIITSSSPSGGTHNVYRVHLPNRTGTMVGVGWSGYVDSANRDEVKFNGINHVSAAQHCSPMFWF